MQKISFLISKDYEALSEELLFGLGALSVSTEDANRGTLKEKAIFAEPGEKTESWEFCRIEALFDEGMMTLEKKTILQEELEVSLDIKIQEMEKKDWVAENQKIFEAIEIESKLLIVPSNYSGSNSENRICISLDPGQAFGSGTHSTTQLCLQWLCQQNLSNKKLIDYGCGSGILAIAAKFLGANDVCLYDIDDIARENAIKNLEKNNITSFFMANNKYALKPCDIVVANILAGPLIKLFPILKDLVLPGGKIVLSGFYPDQVGGLKEVYAQEFNGFTEDRLDEWCRLVASKK